MSERIAIIGAGLMGCGLAQVFVEAGHSVRITDPSAAALASVKQRIHDTLKAMGLPQDSVMRVFPVATVEDAVAKADVVIEAAPEKLELKQQLFEQIEKSAANTCILATNTSVIPITLIMARLRHKHRALGTHWWNPPYLVPLVEVIETADTDAATVAKMMVLLKSVGKLPVHVKRDVPGFVGNRLQQALWREAIALIENGVCDAETVDLVVKNSFGARLAVLGPLENADLVGTDLTLDIHRLVLADLDARPTPSPYLENLVREGRLGFKSHQGFKTWTDEQMAECRAALIVHLQKSFG
jgi:3-hydroxybutyryl-CoA dehydrogenase